MLQTRSIEISKKIDDLMYEREITAMMKLTEKSLSGFFEDEKDIYKITDLKVRYRSRWKTKTRGKSEAKSGIEKFLWNENVKKQDLTQYLRLGIL